MSRIQAIAATALCCLTVAFAINGKPLFAEELSILELGESVEVPSGESAAFAEVTDAKSPVEETKIEFLPALSGEKPADLPLQVDVDAPPPCDFGGCGSVVAPEVCCPNAHHGWNVEIGASALQSQMAISDLDEWPHEFGPAGRISLGYELPSGLGMRSQVWAYSVEGEIRDQTTLNYLYYWPEYNPYYPIAYYLPGTLLYLPLAANGFRSLELTAVTAHFDFFKSIHSRYGDLTLGIGPAYGYSDFSFEPYGASSQYNGGGVSLFGQGSLPLLRRNRWEFAITGQTRLTLLAGSWDIDDLDIYSDSEHSENMSRVEFGFGPEVRLRIGRRVHRSVFLRTLAEFQQWQSDRMGPWAGGDTLGLQGVTMNLGMLW